MAEQRKPGVRPDRTEELARDLFLAFAASPGSAGTIPEEYASRAFKAARAFYAVADEQAAGAR